MTEAYVIIFVMGFAYLLPSFIAAARNHHNGGSILVLNLFLGWTFLGWVAALIWSVSATR
jgi:RsiW-degrading membrane proteinase PrsW (M82 family)